MGDGYRWVDANGASCSPRHRTPATAARWLSRQARRPRVRPRPAVLLAERPPTPATRRIRRRPLSAVERAELVLRLTALEIGGARFPLSVSRWRAAQERATMERNRRRASLGRIMGRSAAMRGARDERRSA